MTTDESEVIRFQKIWHGDIQEAPIRKNYEIGVSSATFPDKAINCNNSTRKDNMAIQYYAGCARY